MNQINFHKTVNTDTADRADLCPHCEEDKTLIHGYSVESDSWGIVGVYAMCKECKEESDKEEEEEEEVCDDCGQFLRNKDLTTWKPYDFCASDGSEPYRICRPCLDGEAHQERLAQDRKFQDME